MRYWYVTCEMKKKIISQYYSKYHSHLVSCFTVLAKRTGLTLEDIGLNLIDVFNWFEGDTDTSSICDILSQHPTNIEKKKC